MRVALEPALLSMNEALRARSLPSRLLYEDRRGGDYLALSIVGTGGFLEIQAHRSGKGAILLIVSENIDVVGEISRTLQGLHRNVSRLKNQQRKLVHRVERMLEHLFATYDVRCRSFPTQALDRLRRSSPEATAMSGLEALFAEREHEDAAQPVDSQPLARKLARKARRYPMRFAAKIQWRGHWRAALYDPASGQFTIGGKIVYGQGEERRRSNAPDDASEDSDESLIREVTVEVAEEAACSVIDCSLPDCDVVDLPDCGGCDCSP